jgi:hypothetical protein
MSLDILKQKYHTLVAETADWMLSAMTEDKRVYLGNDWTYIQFVSVQLDTAYMEPLGYEFDKCSSFGLASKWRLNPRKDVPLVYPKWIVEAALLTAKRLLDEKV